MIVLFPGGANGRRYGGVQEELILPCKRPSSVEEHYQQNVQATEIPLSICSSTLQGTVTLRMVAPRAATIKTQVRCRSSFGLEEPVRHPTLALASPLCVHVYRESPTRLVALSDIHQVTLANRQLRRVRGLVVAHNPR